MSERFFSADPLPTEIGADVSVTLGDAEAHHLLHVLRAKVGDRVTLFDGQGAEYVAEVGRLGRRDVDLRLLERLLIDRERATAIEVAVALPKGDRQKWLVEKLTEVGVGRLTPLITERSVAAPSDGARERLERAVIEASKQCGRNRLMTIGEPREWRQFLDACDAAARWIAQPLAAGRMEHAGASIAIAIGPEGGFTDAEVAAALNAGWRALGLGPRILRIETAALAAVALCGGD